MAFWDQHGDLGVKPIASGLFNPNGNDSTDAGGFGAPSGDGGPVFNAGGNGGDLRPPNPPDDGGAMALGVPAPARGPNGQVASGAGGQAFAPGAGGQIPLGPPPPRDPNGLIAPGAGGQAFSPASPQADAGAFGPPPSMPSMPPPPPQVPAVPMHHDLAPDAGAFGAPPDTQRATAGSQALPIFAQDKNAGGFGVPSMAPDVVPQAAPPNFGPPPDGHVLMQSPEGDYAHVPHGLVDQAKAQGAFVRQGGY